MQWFLQHPIITGLAAAIIFEFITILLRFRFNFTSPTHTRSLAKLTNGFRIHHGYPGVVLLAAVPVVPNPTILSSLVIIVALMLFVSDAIHHAIILPIFAGHHEFHIKYPPTIN